MKNLMTNIREEIYSSSYAYINQFIAGKKVSMLSSGLFLDLPWNIEFKKEKDYVFNHEDLTSLLTFDKSEGTAVTLYFKYSNMNSLKDILSFIQDKRNMQYLAFVYLYRLQNVLRKHPTELNKDMIDYALINFDADKWETYSQDQKNILISAAQDHAATWFSRDIILDGSIMSEHYNFPYNKYFTDKEFDEIEIAKYLLSNAQPPKINNDGTADFDGSKFELDNSSNGDSRASDSSDNSSNSSANPASPDDIASMLDGLSNSIRDKLKGDGSQRVNELINGSIPVEMDWAKKLEKTLKYQVYNQTNNFSNSWSGFNNKYLGIATMPKKKFYKTSMNLIISIDQSGSISESELKKLIYIIDNMRDSLKHIHVIIHDSEVVKYVHIKSGPLKDNKIDEAFKKRIASGGTSHIPVFKKADDIINSFRRDNFLYISFSDNYSDIEGSWGSYKYLKKIKCYFLATEDRKVNINHANVINVKLREK